MATVKAKHHTIMCETRASFGDHLTPFKRDDLIAWLQLLPENAKLKFEGIRSGHVYFVAAWTIPMETAQAGAEPPKDD